MADFLTIITICEYIILLICQSFSLFYFGTIFWQTKLRKRTQMEYNAVMDFYIFVEFVFSLFCIIYVAYLVAMWRPDENIYNAYWLYFLGSPVSVLLITQPLVSCFLGIDRCLCLLFVFKKTKLITTCVLVATAIGIAIFWGIEIPLYILGMFPKKAATECRSSGCLSTDGSGQLYTMFRYITAVGSVVIGTILFQLIKKKTIKHNSMKSTRLVVITVTAAIIFDFFPHLVSFSLSTFANQNLTKLIGPYSLTVSSINSLVCGYSYYKSMKKNSKKKITSVTTTIF